MIRRGVISLYLLLSLSALLTGLSGFLYASSHVVRTETEVFAGLRAQYAAESGALWALEKIKKDGVTAATVEFSLDEKTKCKVRIQKGEEPILSRGEDTATGALRFVRLKAAVEETDEGYRVTVSSVGKEKWS